MAAYPPTVETQRQILTNLKNEYQNNGFAKAMNADALEAQDPGAGPADIAAHEKKIQEERDISANCYAAARRMDEKLAKLPKPKDDKKNKKP